MGKNEEPAAQLRIVINTQLVDKSENNDMA